MSGAYFSKHSKPWRDVIETAFEEIDPYKITVSEGFAILTDAEKLDAAEAEMRRLAARCRANADAVAGDDEEAIVSRALSELQAKTFDSCAEIIQDFKRGRT